MHHLLVAAAFALVMVAPYMQAFPKQDDTTIQSPDDPLNDAEDADESER